MVPGALVVAAFVKRSMRSRMALEYSLEEHSRARRAKQRVGSGVIGSPERARLRYLQIRSRCETHPAYFWVQVRITEEDFVRWFRGRDFTGCEVDRIDNSGHYELGNIQLLTKEQHAKKSGREKLQQFAPYFQNVYVCADCHEAVGWDDMNKDNRRPEGVSNFCNSCTSKKRKARK